MTEQTEPDDIKEVIEKAIEGTGMTIMPDDEFASVMETMRQNVEASDAKAKEQGKRFLDEEQDKELIETWWREAQECRSIDDAARFAHRLVEDYRHDYGTICHAVAAAGVAMANAVGMPAGITGFQAGFIGWNLHSKFMQWGDEPRRIVDFSHLLFPQYDDKWATITPDTHEWLIKQAEKHLTESPNAHPNVVARWKVIASGKLPSFVTVGES